MDRSWLAVLGIALGAMVAARLLAHLALEDVPHVQDEQAYWLQAQTLALGRLWSPLALPRAAFNTWFVDDRWARFGIFPPGWPAVLALGIRMHAPFWVNPALHGITTLVVSVAGGRLGGRRLRVLCAALYGLSPQALVLAASLMSHSLIALAGSVVLVACAAEWRGERSTAWAALAGAAVGAAALTRPLCACVLAIEMGIAYGGSRRRPQASDARTIVAAAVPLIAALALLLAYNKALTGEFTLFPQNAYFDTHLPPVDLPSFRYHPGCNDLGFGPGHGCQEIIVNATHTLGNAISNTGDNLIAWALLAGGGPLAFVAAAYALRRPATRSLGLVLLLPPALVVGAYALYWYAGTCYGARFYHAGLPFLLVAAASGLDRLRPRALFAATLVAWFGWNAVAFAKSCDELRGGYWGNDARFRRLAESWKEPRALLMVAFTPEPAPIRPLFWMTRLLREGAWLKSQRVGSALAVDAPRLEGPLILAKFHPCLVDELRARFPERELWMYVASPRAADDFLFRYDAARDGPLERPCARPADNFDGYEVSGPVP